MDGDDAPLDLSEFPGMIIDDVIVPIPSEIFSIMGSWARSGLVAKSWHEEPQFRNRSRLALAFGISVADGIIAVQAENKDGIEQAGRTVLKLSEALGLAGSRTETHPSDNQCCRSERLGRRPLELDRTQKTVRETMERCAIMILLTA